MRVCIGGRCAQACGVRAHVHLARCTDDACTSAEHRASGCSAGCASLHTTPERPHPACSSSRSGQLQRVERHLGRCRWQGWGAGGTRRRPCRVASEPASARPSRIVRRCFEPRPYRFEPRPYRRAFFSLDFCLRLKTPDLTLRPTIWLKVRRLGPFLRSKVYCSAGPFLRSKDKSLLGWET